MLYPKIGIRPVIDGRWGGVRESLENQTMRMAENEMCIRDRNYDKYNWDEHRDHFILADCPDHDVDFGEGKKSIFALEGTEILIQRDKEVQMAAHEYGKGRGVYISGLPYSFAGSFGH